MATSSAKPGNDADADDSLAIRPIVSWDRGDTTNDLPFVSKSFPLQQIHPLEQRIDAGDVSFVPRPVWYPDAAITRSEKSPYLKRTKKSFGIGDTPPVSRNHPLLNVGYSSGCRDTRQYSQPPDDEVSKRNVGGQQGSENTFASMLASKSRLSNCPLSASRSKYRFFDSVGSSDLDAILVRSFADISIHTIPATQSPHPGTDHQRFRSRHLCTRTSHPLNEINLAPRAFVDHDGDSFHPTYLFPDVSLDFDTRRWNNLSRHGRDVLHDEGLVDAAVAKLERKTRAAKMHQLNDSLLREALWQDELVLLGGN